MPEGKWRFFQVGQQIHVWTGAEGHWIEELGEFSSPSPWWFVGAAAMILPVSFALARLIRPAGSALGQGDPEVLAAPIIPQGQEVVQVIGDNASDARLAVFLASHPGQVGPLRITETGEQLIVSPRPIPMVFVTICALAPAAVIVVVLVREALERITALTVIGMVMLPLALISVLGILYLVNRHLLSKGDYLRANIARSKIELPRAGITLAREQVVELVQVDGWKTDVSERWHRYELTVLARAFDGLRRYPLAVGTKRDIVRLSERLSSLMGCRVRQIHV